MRNITQILQYAQKNKPFNYLFTDTEEEQFSWLVLALFIMYLQPHSKVHMMHWAGNIINLPNIMSNAISDEITQSLTGAKNKNTAWVRSEVSRSLHLHPNVSPMVSSLFKWLLSSGTAATRGEQKRVNLFRPVMSWGSRMCPYRKHFKMKCVSKPTILKDCWTQQCAGCVCKKVFVSQPRLSLFPMGECDFLLSYQRQLTLRKNRWFTVRLLSFSSE